MFALTPVLRDMAVAAGLRLNGRKSKLLYYGAASEQDVVEELRLFDLFAEVQIARSCHAGGIWGWRLGLSRGRSVGRPRCASTRLVSGR